MDWVLTMIMADTDFPLPPLRDDLRLFDGPSEADGLPTWTVYDPGRHRFFRINWIAFEFLSRWK
ncbi:hypothetical protein CCP2SC5_280002 [Azospirillaceae bacterium]